MTHSGESDSSKIAEIEWPSAWFGIAHWQFAELIKVLRHEPTGKLMFIAGGVLTDGTNLMGLTWEERSGQFIARCGPATNWGIEERIVPAPGYVRRTWAQIIEAMVYGKNAAAEELGGIPS